MIKHHKTRSDENYGYNHCAIRTALKVNAMEYLLSSDNPHVTVSLRYRIKLAMPAPTSSGKGKIFSIIGSKYKDTNVVLHEACLLGGLPAALNS